MTSKAIKKELFAALAMLVVMTMAITASTYAWLAMNAEATAENMRVSIASDASYLLIEAGIQDADHVQATREMVASAATTAALKPVAHDVTITNSAMAGDYTNWYYKYSNDPGSSNQDTFADTTLTAIHNMGDYVLKSTFSITVADGSNPLDDLIVTDCAITSSASDGAIAVKVIVATSEAAVELDRDTPRSDTPIAATVTSDDVVIVDVYVYWDGNDDEVYTNNYDKLNDISVSVIFTGTVRED